MSYRVKPKVYVVAMTRTQPDLGQYLRDIGADKFRSDAGSCGECLVECMGRMCYRSWQPGMNENVTKVRKGNKPYIANLLKSGHGSVLEHVTATFIFRDVSRVFTHELVRHRVGTAMSQESLRYVSLDELGFFVPPELEGTEVAAAVDAYEQEIATLKAELITPDMPFSKKKKITSAIRRLAPIGLATSIGWTANVRTLRHVIQMRTSRHAEVEMRVVFNDVALQCRKMWPNLFQDFKVEDVDGYPEWTTDSKA